jgi:structural maintenance of chromosome 2
VIVDTEITAKKLLQRGQLQRRTTIIPLNKIVGHSLEPRTVRRAQELVSCSLTENHILLAGTMVAKREVIILSCRLPFCV